jgi:hypothetical protein
MYSLDSLIARSGLLLVVSSSPDFSFIGGVGKKLSKHYLDVRNIFAGLHSEHPYGCCRE